MAFYVQKKEADMLEIILIAIATVCVVIRTYIEVQKYRSKDPK